MKRIVLFLMAMFATVGYTFAQNTTQDIITFDDVVIPQGGSAVLVVKLTNPENKYAGLQCDFTLPEGVTATEIESANRVAQVMDGKDKAFTTQMANNTTFYRMMIYNQIKESIPGTEGDIAYITVTADATTALGEYEGTVSGRTMTTAERVEYKTEAVGTFKVTISDQWILDENSTAVPAASEGEVNVLVKRTIVANQWSTICLPFEMTKEQVSAVFGDAQFALFDSYEVDGDEPGKTAVTDAQSITINFAKDDMTDGLIANFPYLIKTTENLSEINVEGVVITPDEESADITYETKISGKKYTHGHFYGTLRAGQVIPANDLFLNNNKFYYSTGKTHIKGFRGYFELKDLTSAISSNASVKIYVDGEATSIDGLNIKYAVEGVYDLSGRKIQLENGDLNKLQKGVYIIDGKKVTIK